MCYTKITHSKKHSSFITQVKHLDLVWSKMLSNGKHEEAIVHVAKMCMLEGCVVLLEKTELETSASEGTFG